METTNSKSSIQTKNAFFFSHDCNARNNEKILELRSQHGAEAYGIYFMLIELLMESTDYRLRAKYATLAFALQVDADLLQKVVEDYELFGFDVEGEFFYSPSLIKRVQPLEQLRERRREAGRKSGEVRRANRDKLSDIEDGINTIEHNANTCSTLVAPPRTKESRQEQRKTEQIIKKESRANQSELATATSDGKADRFVPPTVEELNAYCVENAMDIDTSSFLDFYQSKGWLVGTTKMRDWRAALRNWYRREVADVQKRRRGLATLPRTNSTNFKNDKVYEQF